MLLTLVGIGLCFVWRRKGDVVHAAELPVGVVVARRLCPAATIAAGLAERRDADRRRRIVRAATTSTRRTGDDLDARIDAADDDRSPNRVDSTPPDGTSSTPDPHDGTSAPTDPSR